MKSAIWTCLTLVGLTLASQPAAANQIDEAIFQRGTKSWGIAYKGHWRKFSVKIEGSKQWIKARPAYEVWLEHWSNTTAQRITLPSAELALRYAATRRFKSARVIEVRGNQVLWINGLSRETVQNPGHVEQVLADGWKETSSKHASFRASPGPVLYRGLYGSTGSLLTFQRQYGVRFTLPVNASAQLKAWADKLLDDALTAGATVEKRSDGHYRYTTHSRFDTSVVAFPPLPSGGSLAGALSAAVVRRVPAPKPAPKPADPLQAQDD